MKKIVLIGDSTRMGYDILLREAYRGVANVYFPKENSCFAEYTLRWLHEWKNEMNCGDDVDLVYWNVGAWDNLILFDDGPLTPIEVYSQYMERICKRMEFLFPQAKKVFETTAPMYEELFANPKFAVRHNTDIEAYNKAAVKAVKKYGHIICDVYSLMASKPLDYHSDVAHYYTRNGATALVEHISREIDAILGIQAGTVNYDAWFSDMECYEGVAWLKRRNAEIKNYESDISVLGV